MEQKNKGGRPKNPDAFDAAFTLKIHKDVLWRLDDRARAQGMQRAEYIRWLLRSAVES